MRWCCLLRTANGRQSSMRSIWRRDSLLHPHLTKYESLYSHSFNRFASGTTRHILHYIPRNTLSRNPASLYPRNCYDVPLGFVQINPSLPLPKLQSTPIFRQSFSYFKPQSSPPWNGGGDSGSSDRNAYRRFGEESGSKWQNTQRPRWYLYRNYFAVGTGAFGVFYVYNLETVEVSERQTREPIRKVLLNENIIFLALPYPHRRNLLIICGGMLHSSQVAVASIVSLTPLSKNWAIRITKTFCKNIREKCCRTATLLPGWWNA